MPTVPRPQGRQVFAEPASGEKQSISATEETFGGGATNKAVVSAATTLNTTLQARFAIERENANKVRVQDASNKLGIAESDILNKVGSMQGLDAATKSVEFATTEHKKRVEELAKDLTPKQRQDFNFNANKSYVEIYSKANAHAATQREAHDKKSTEDRISGLTNKVAENVDNPKAVAIIKGDIEQTFLDKAFRDKRISQEEMKSGKFSDSTVIEDLLKVRSEANIMVAQSLIDNGRTDKAKEYLNSLTSKEIDVEKKNKLKVLADNYIEKIKTEAKEQIELQYDKTTIDAGKMFTEGKLSLGQIDSWVKQGAMKPETASALTASLFSKKKFFGKSEWKKFAYSQGKASAKNENYSDKGSYFVSKLRGLKNGEPAGETVMDAFKAYSEGLINEKDLGWVVYVANEAKDKKKINFVYNQALNESKYGSNSVEKMAESMMNKSFKVGYKKDDVFERGGMRYKVTNDSDPFDPDVELLK